MRHPADGTLRRLLDEPAGVADATELWCMRNVRPPHPGDAGGLQDIAGADDVGLEHRVPRGVGRGGAGQVDDRVDPVHEGEDGVVVGEVTAEDDRVRRRVGRPRRPSRAAG